MESKPVSSCPRRAAVEQSVCPAHRHFAAETGGKASSEAFLQYMQDTWGSSGLLHWLFERHVRAQGESIDVRDMDWSFVKDPWFTGVSRFGTSATTLESLYAHLDPDGVPGQRAITRSDLPELGALLRRAFPRREGESFWAREIGIAQTVAEWALLLNAQGERTSRGQLALREGVHAAILRGELPNGPARRKTDVHHAVPGLWGSLAGNFVSTAGVSARAAVEKLGEGAAEARQSVSD